MTITHDSLPQAVSQLCDDIAIIKRHLLEKSDTSSLPPDELLTVQQTADYLNLHVSTIYGLVSRMQIPCMKKGKRLYFSKVELIEWLKSGRKKTSKDLSIEVEKHISNKSTRIG